MVVVARAVVVAFVVEVAVIVVVVVFDEPESSLPQAVSVNVAERTMIPALVRRTIELEIRI